MRLLFASILMTVPYSANATPIYLKCQLNIDVGKKDAWDVTLNEETGMVSYHFPDMDRSFSVRGVFTADKVTFNGFTIDRTNFAFKRDLSGIQAPGRTPIIDEGKCTFAEVKRAF